MLKAYVRHDHKEILDKLVDLPMTLTSKLASAVNVDVFGSLSQACTGAKKLTGMNVPKGSSVPVFLIAPVVNDKHLKHATVGHYLTV